MVAISDIEEYSRRIGKEFDADRVIPFGSFAQGQANEWSDIARQEGIVIPA